MLKPHGILPECACVHLLKIIYKVVLKLSSMYILFLQGYSALKEMDCLGWGCLKCLRIEMLSSAKESTAEALELDFR